MLGASVCTATETRKGNERARTANKNNVQDFFGKMSTPVRKRKAGEAAYTIHGLQTYVRKRNFASQETTLQEAELFADNTESDGLMRPSRCMTCVETFKRPVCLRSSSKNRLSSCSGSVVTCGHLDYSFEHIANNSLVHTRTKHLQTKNARETCVLADNPCSGFRSANNLPLTQDDPTTTPTLHIVFCV